MALVRGVPVSVVDVVQVVPVLDALVAAVGAVLVSVFLVDDMALVRALMPVVVVAAVDVAVVQVVDVVAVLDRDMPAVRSVLVRMVVVDLMLSCHMGKDARSAVPPHRLPRRPRQLTTSLRRKRYQAQAKKTVA